MSTTSTPAGTVRRVYQVTGMTCGHCAAAVQREVGAIDGVHDVSVDLPTGDVVVTSSHPVVEAQLVAALDEAGYQLAG